jgi:hypothetical protein
MVSDTLDRTAFSGFYNTFGNISPMGADLRQTIGTLFAAAHQVTFLVAQDLPWMKQKLQLSRIAKCGINVFTGEEGDWARLPAAV